MEAAVDNDSDEDWFASIDPPPRFGDLAICLEIPQRVCLAITAASARLLADADDTDARRAHSAGTEFELCACAGASK